MQPYRSLRPMLSFAPLLASLALAPSGCQSNPGGGGSGGSATGSGGAATGSGGAGTGSGGSATGSGGAATGSGGAVASTGGAVGTGGRPGSGGAGTGGTGTGGRAATGGASGAASGTGGGSGGAGGSGAGGTILGDGCVPGTLPSSGMLMGRYGSLKVTAGGQEYFMQVNEWGSSSPQTMAYGGDFFFKMTQQEASRPTNGAPTGFPSMFIGANSRNVTANSGLPKQVSALTTVPTTWNWKDNGTLGDATANSYNVTYDVWFSTSAAGEPNASGPSGGYLMVWLYDPPDAQPIGMPVYEGVTIPGVAGTWDVWIGPNGTRPCISYVRTEPTLSMSFDLNVFIKDAVANRRDMNNQPVLMNTWYLTNVFIGFEIWRGGLNIETTNFCVKVN
jgi:hypothetical protein